MEIGRPKVGAFFSCPLRPVCLLLTCAALGRNVRGIIKQLGDILAHMRDGEMHNTVFITADGKPSSARLQVPTVVYTVTLHHTSWER